MDLDEAVFREHVKGHGLLLAAPGHLHNALRVHRQHLLQSGQQLQFHHGELAAAALQPKVQPGVLFPHVLKRSIILQRFNYSQIKSPREWMQMSRLML